MKSKKVNKSNNNIGIIAVICAASILALCIAFVLTEALNPGKLRIYNNTDKTISSIDVIFEEEDYETGEYNTVLYLYSGKVDAGSATKISLDKKLDFRGTEASCCMYVSFDDGETIAIEDGYFTTLYKGTFTFDFYQENGDYFLKAKAADGLFRNSTSSSWLDETYILYPDEADWEYAEEL